MNEAEHSPINHGDGSADESEPTTMGATAATRDVVGLFLLDSRNDYQAALAKSAQHACERRGLKLEVYDATNSSDRQLEQILACLRGPGRDRRAALLVHPVLDG